MKSIQTISLMLIASIILLSFTAKAQNAYTLTIEVENLRNSKGVLQVALYNKDGSIPDEQYKNYYKLQTTNIESGNAEVTFKNLPKGKYAINILHDENKNGKIDKGLILPKEGIGFSNYSSRINQSTKFQKSKF